MWCTHCENGSNFSILGNARLKLVTTHDNEIYVNLKRVESLPCKQSWRPPYIWLWQRLMPYWNSCATAEPKQPSSQQTQRWYRITHHHQRCVGAWAVNTERYTLTVKLSQLANVRVYLSLSVCLCLWLALTLALTSIPVRSACVRIVAVAVCSLCLYPFSSVRKSMGLFGVCRVATVPTWKTQKTTVSTFKIDARTHSLARIQAHSIQAMNC